MNFPVSKLNLIVEPAQSEDSQKIGPSLLKSYKEVERSAGASDMGRESIVAFTGADKKFAGPWMTVDASATPPQARHMSDVLGRELRKVVYSRIRGRVPAAHKLLLSSVRRCGTNSRRCC